MQFYVMLRTKKREAVLYHAQDEKGGAVLRRAEDEGRIQFYVMPRTKIGCSFMSCLGQRSDAVLCHAQDEVQMQFYVMPRTRINLKLRGSPVMNQEYSGSTSAHYT